MASSHRTDEQLAAILDQTENWTVHGPAGRRLGSATSLRHALDRAAGYALVVAVCLQPHDRIIVFLDQMERLRNSVAA